MYKYKNGKIKKEKDRKTKKKTRKKIYIYYKLYSKFAEGRERERGKE